jgi:hypothetical protein
VSAFRLIAAEKANHPPSVIEAFKRRPATAPRVVRDHFIRCRQLPELIMPREHRVAHTLARPPSSDRARVATLAVLVGVALAVTRLRRVPAAATDPPVARLDLAGLRAQQSPSVCLMVAL